MSILDFTYALTQPNSADDVKALVLDQIRPYGFTNFGYAILAFKKTTPSEYFTLNTLNTQFMDDYSSQLRILDNPLAHHCYFNDHPILWSAVFNDDLISSLPENQRALLKMSQAIGLKNGVTIPLSKRGQFYAGMSLIADPDAPTFELEAGFLEHQETILKLVEAFHQAVNLREIAISDWYRLTPREVDMLQWLSNGYLQKEIAEKLSISTSQVEKAVNSARKRLKAETTIQAVSKAANLNIV